MRHLTVTVGWFLVGSISGFQSGTLSERQAAHPSPSAHVVSSISSSSTYFVDVTNRSDYRIQTLRFEFLIESSETRRPQKLVFNHDFSFAAGELPDFDAGPILPRVTRRFTVQLGSDVPAGAKVEAVVTFVLYSDGQVVGDATSLSVFSRRRAAAAREVAALIAIVEDARNLDPSAAKKQIRGGLDGRQQLLREADLPEMVEISLREMLRQTLAVDDRDIATALLRLNDSFLQIKQNVERPLYTPTR